MVLQQGANLLVQRRKGLLNGYIVGLYPAGAMIAAPLFGWANAAFGFRVTLAGLAVALLLTRPGSDGPHAVCRNRISPRRRVVEVGTNDAPHRRFRAAFGGLLPGGRGWPDRAQPGGRHHCRLWRCHRDGVGSHHRDHRSHRLCTRDGRLAGGPVSGPLRIRLRARSRGDGRGPAHGLAGAADGGIGTGHDRHGLRLRLRLHRRRDRALLAAGRLWQDRQPAVHRVVRGSGDVADPGGLPVRHHPRLPCDGDRRRLRQPAWSCDRTRPPSPGACGKWRLATNVGAINR